MRSSAVQQPQSQLRSFVKSRESLMPAYNQKSLSDKYLDDIVAFLLSIGMESK